MKNKKMTTKELKSEYKALYQLIYQIGCYGTRDIMLLQDISIELEQRGVEIEMTPSFN